MRRESWGFAVRGQEAAMLTASDAREPPERPLPPLRHQGHRGGGPGTDGVQPPRGRLLRAARREPEPASRPDVPDLPARRAASAAARQAAANAPQRLDVHGRGGRLPRSELRRPLPDRARRPADVPPLRDDADRLRKPSSGVPARRAAAGLLISRLLKGGWQLAGGHGAIDGEAALDDMRRFVDAGITSFDCADIYTGVEERIGEFLRAPGRRGRTAAAEAVQVHTKFVPDRAALPSLTRRDVERAIERSLRRLGRERLDLVQFHWWDFSVPGWLEAALLARRPAARGQAPSRRGHQLRLRAPARAARRRDRGRVPPAPVLAGRPQAGERDDRALRGARRGMLAYGSLLGGFLSERWLGAADPPRAAREPLAREVPADDRRVRRLGRVPAPAAGVDAVARRHGTTIGAVAIRHALELPGVAGVIVGARHARHLEATLAAISLALDATDAAHSPRPPVAPPAPRATSTRSNASPAPATRRSCATT